MTEYMAVRELYGSSGNVRDWQRVNSQSPHLPFDSDSRSKSNTTVANI
jgi:hypothetical protein